MFLRNIVFNYLYLAVDPNFGSNHFIKVFEITENVIAKFARKSTNHFVFLF